MISQQIYFGNSYSICSQMGRWWMMMFYVHNNRYTETADRIVSFVMNALITDYIALCLTMSYAVAHYEKKRLWKHLSIYREHVKTAHVILSIPNFVNIASKEDDKHDVYVRVNL